MVKGKIPYSSLSPGVPVPLSDLESARRRPVIEISNNPHNRKTEDIVVIAVTSNIEKKDYSNF
jgi:mRNA interferase MazF